ncbi:gcc2 and gcc3 domain-containing protein, partial [Cystoisospora suis]
MKKKVVTLCVYEADDHVQESTQDSGIRLISLFAYGRPAEVIVFENSRRSPQVSNEGLIPPDFGALAVSAPKDGTLVTAAVGENLFIIELGKPRTVAQLNFRSSPDTPVDKEQLLLWYQDEEKDSWKDASFSAEHDASGIRVVFEKDIRTTKIALQASPSHPNVHGGAVRFSNVYVQSTRASGALIVVPQECLAGTYQDEQGQAACKPCPAGRTCAGRKLKSTSPCPAGFYCEGGDAFPRSCPAGTYSNQEGLSSASQCTPCPAGKYCAVRGAKQPTGSCSA